MLEDCGNIVFLLRSFLQRRVLPGLLTVKKEKNRCMDLCLNNSLWGEVYTPPKTNISPKKGLFQ